MNRVLSEASRTPADVFRRLSRRQQRFVAFYMSMPNAAEAARKAGYSPKGAKVKGSRLLARRAIQAALRCDGIEAARWMLRSDIPHAIEVLSRCATSDGLSTPLKIRAGRALLDFAGVLKQGRGRRA